MKLIHKTDVPRSERTARASSSAKSFDTRVELHQVEDLDGVKGFGWEVRIVHPDRSPASPGSSGVEGPQAPEVYRYRDEEQARRAYEVYTAVLTDQPTDEIE